MAGLAARAEAAGAAGRTAVFAGRDGQDRGVLVIAGTIKPASADRQGGKRGPDQPQPPPLPVLAGAGQFPDHTADAPISISESRPNPASATDRADSADSPDQPSQASDLVLVAAGGLPRRTRATLRAHARAGKSVPSLLLRSILSFSSRATVRPARLNKP